VLSYGGRFGYQDAGETANTQVSIHDYGDKQIIFEVRGLKTDKLRGAGVGVNWDNRFARPTYAWAGATWAFGPWRGGAGAGQVANVGAWEVGLGGVGGQVVVDLAEVADFILGWFFIDILKDDYGWAETRYDDV